MFGLGYGHRMGRLKMSLGMEIIFGSFSDLKSLNPQIINVMLFSSRNLRLDTVYCYKFLK